MQLPEIILIFAVLGVVAFFASKFLFRQGTAVEDRRRGAAKLAAKLSTLGLKKIPAFLIDYSVGDYSGMSARIGQLAELFTDGEGAVLDEFDKVYNNVLEAKLRTPEGRAYLLARLNEYTGEGTNEKTP